MACLRRFFVTTVFGSVYEVTAPQKQNSNPIIKKIADFGENKVPVGECHSEGDTIGITRIGIYLYLGRRSKGKKSWTESLENIKMLYWRWKTEQVASLFLSREEALKCAKDKTLIECDRRWERQTKKVLEKIGTEHPHFTISKHEVLAITYGAQQS